jgi:predicted ATPase
MLLKRIAMRNLLSFRDAELELGPLNVLIGPNGCGKSNLIECIGLLQALPTDLNRAIALGGGAPAWINNSQRAGEIAELKCEVEVSEDRVFNYDLGFRAVNQYLQIDFETGLAGSTHSLNRKGVKAEIIFPFPPHPAKATSSFDAQANQSVFSAYKDPKQLISEVGKRLEEIKIYRYFDLQASSAMRSGVSSSANQNFLEEDGSNLATFLHHLEFTEEIDAINGYLHELSEEFEKVKTNVGGAIMQTYIAERGLRLPTPSMRLSDGTLRFLCLISLLVSSPRPSLICIDEPELGLHPDAVSIVARALKEASEHVQIIVTTHSQEFVSAMSDKPESVVVCEKRDNETGTSFKRLSGAKLESWLEEYTLGELWRKNEIGGNRW